MRNLVFATLIFIALPCLAEEQKLPILLEIPRDIGVSSGAGLISLWADSSVNKQSRDRVRRFKEAIGTLDFPAAAARAIACIANDKETTNCQEVRIIERDPKDTDDLLRETLKGLPAHRAILVSITSEMVPAQILIRAVKSDVRLEKGKTIQRRRIMSALVLRRAPAALTVDKNKSALALEEYWRGGDTPHIVDVVREALGEAATLLSTLDATLDESGKRPKNWDDLPKIRDLEKSCRVKCSGGQSLGLHFFGPAPLT